MKAMMARVGLILFLSHMAGASEEPYFERGEHRMEDAAIQLMFQEARTACQPSSFRQLSPTETFLMGGRRSFDGRHECNSNVFTGESDCYFRAEASFACLRSPSSDSARVEPSTEVEGYGEAFGGCTDGKAHLEAQARAASMADAEGICESKVKRLSKWSVSSYCINVYDHMRGGARARATFRCDKSSG